MHDTSRPSRSLRPATLADAEAIAALHADVWRAIYRALAPVAAIAALNEAHRLQQWQSMLTTKTDEAITLVAIQDDVIVGFARVAPPQEPLFGDRRELKYLYVARSQARRGIGRALLQHLAGLERRAGTRGIGLGVVAGNAPAIAFYQALAARPVGRYQDPGPLWRSDNLLYAWDDLSVLADGSVSGG